MSAVAQLIRQEAAEPHFALLLDPEKQLEWVNGHAEVKEMAGARHSRIGTRLITKLGVYLETNPIGELYGPDATFTIGQRQRLPDVSFVADARIPPEGDPVGIWTIAPDLAVEIVSPNDLLEEVTAKIHEYFAAGVRQVWLISPQFRTVTIHESLTRVRLLTEGDELSGVDLLPGFRCPVRALFTPHRPQSLTPNP